MARRINIQLYAQQEAALKDLKKKTGTPIIELVRRAVARYLNDIDRQGLQAELLDVQKTDEDCVRT